EMLAAARDGDVTQARVTPDRYLAVMTARTVSVAVCIALVSCLSAAPARAQATGAQDDPAKPTVPQGIEIPPLPPNPRVDKAKREAEERRREYEAALARSRGEEVDETETPAPAPRPMRQQGKYDLFAGYAALHNGTGDLNFGLGWVGSLTAPYNDSTQIVVELGGSYHSEDVVGVTTARAMVHTFTAGPQRSYAFSNGARAFAFIQGGLAVD